MPKKAAEIVEDIKYKKYVFILEDNSVILVNAPSRMEAVKILAPRLKNNGFEKSDFQLLFIEAEIKEDGSVVFCDSNEEVK